MISEIKKSSDIITTEAHDQQLQGLIDAYGVNGILAQMASMLQHSVQNSGSLKEEKELRKVAELLLAANERVMKAVK